LLLTCFSKKPLVFQAESVAITATLRRREAERTTNVVLALGLLGLAAVSFALSRPMFEWIVAPRALALGLEVATAQLMAVAVAVVCGALCITCVGVLLRDARSLGLVHDPKHPLGASLARDETLPSTPTQRPMLTPTSATKPMMPTPPNKAPVAVSSRSVFSPATPPMRSPLGVSLTDERQLNSFLQRAGSSPMSGGGFGSPSNLSLSRPSFAYQTSYRASGAAEDAGFKESEAAKLVLQRLKIELAMHSEWPYRMRRWMSELVERCVALSDELRNRQAAVERAFRIEYAAEEKRRKLQQLQQQQKGGGGGGWGDFGGGGAWGVSAFTGGADAAWGGFGGTQATEEQMRQEAMRRAEESVHRKHELLQRYLDVTQDRSCKDYVLERLRQLAEGGTLSGYEWNGGGKFKGREWSHDSLPTDAQLLFHLFVTKLNTLLHEQARESGMDVGPTPFSNRYLLITPQTPDPKNKDVLLWLQRRSPPHLKVVVRGDVWEVAPGQNNLIHALVLYVYAVAKEERGVIEMMSLAQTAPELLKIVTERK
jgi:hypothetical protein